MNDLFQNSGTLERIPAPNAELLVQRDFLPAGDLSDLMRVLTSETNWREESVIVWGKRHLQPRLIAWVGDKAYSYSGSTLHPDPWTETLLQLKEKVEKISGATFNSVLLNLYRNGNDRMGAHSDDEAELGTHPIIASISVGATRRMRFIPKPHIAAQKKFSLALTAGSLLIMRGQTQDNWLHEIPREVNVLEPRINLTFRDIK